MSLLSFQNQAMTFWALTSWHYALCCVLCILVSNPSTSSSAPTSYFIARTLRSFAVLCKVGQITLARDGSNLIDVPGIDALEDTTIAMSRFLLTFFVAQDDSDDTIMMRPLTNSNLILDFYRYKAAPYHKTVTKYLALKNKKSIAVPDYDTQYHQIMRYFVRHKCLHTYSKFTLDGRMSSTLNTKSLQYVAGADGDAVYKLGRSNYYKYRAVNFMFGCNSNILMAMESFADFNAWRKNQLLRFHKALLLESSSSDGGGGDNRNKNIVDGLTSATKYRDYCEYLERFRFIVVICIDHMTRVLLREGKEFFSCCGGQNCTSFLAAVSYQRSFSSSRFSFAL